MKLWQELCRLRWTNWQVSQLQISGKLQKVVLYDLSQYPVGLGRRSLVLVLVEFCADQTVPLFFQLKESTVITFSNTCSQEEWDYQKHNRSWKAERHGMEQLMENFGTQKFCFSWRLMKARWFLGGLWLFSTLALPGAQSTVRSNGKWAALFSILGGFYLCRCLV